MKYQMIIVRQDGVKQVISAIEGYNIKGAVLREWIQDTKDAYTVPDGEEWQFAQGGNCLDMYGKKEK